jgi:anthranilate phosphoribosyltransferase
VGTGGDASGSYNISTLATFIVAGAGVVVAKHGNRALSSKSGAADCLQSLGVNVNLSPNKVSDCIKKVGLGFMFAPSHHPAMKHVGAARAELGTRTIFNILGPLSNPASVKLQLIGVFSKAWLKPIAEVLRDLGSETVWVVHGKGLDEITGTGETSVVALEEGNIREFKLNPADFGMKTCMASDLVGGDANHNAAALLAVLEGAKNAYHDVAVMNAAAAIMVAGRAETLREATDMALNSLSSKAALGKLNELIRVSND